MPIQNSFSVIESDTISFSYLKVLLSEIFRFEKVQTKPNSINLVELKNLSITPIQ